MIAGQPSKGKARALRGTVPGHTQTFIFADNARTLTW
jgi:hypothetical protein